MVKRGFTLIELLVVIAIIAILAAILFPIYASAKEKGRQATCCSNLKQLTQAFFQYTDDNDGYLPICQRRQMMTYGDPSKNGNPIEWTGSRWSAYGSPPVPCDVRTGSLWKYTRSVQLFNCPSDKDLPCYFLSNGTNTKIAWSNSSSWSGIDIKPADLSALPRGFGVTYSLNEFLTQKSFMKGQASYITTIKLAPAVVGRSGQVLFLIHERRGDPSGLPAGQNDGFFQWTGGDPQGKIHWEGTTCSFADGHVRWMSTNEIQKMIDLYKVSKGGKNVPWCRNSYYYGMANPQYSE